MELIINNSNILFPWWLVLLGGIFTAFTITYVSIPSILRVSHKIGLYERTNGRGSHKGNVPTLGGVAIFAAIVVTGSLFSKHDMVSEFQYILGAMVILFFTGIKDDLLVMDPKKKLLAQILAAGIIVVLGNLRITSFQGFANINEIPYLVSVLFSIFVFVVIINGFNLIDGIDGLASGVAIVVSLTFGVWFILAKQYEFAIVPFGLTGALIAFFRFNVFSKKNKIFLGDTGSLTIGLIIAVIAIKFLEFDHTLGFPASIMSAPAVAVGILIVPLFDTLRVFTIRIFGGDSPFKADRKHIHHRLLDLGCSHIHASLIIIGINLLFIAVVFLLRDLGNLKLLFILLVLASALSYIPVFLLNKRRHKFKVHVNNKLHLNTVHDIRKEAV